MAGPGHVAVPCVSSIRNGRRPSGRRGVHVGGASDGLDARRHGVRRSADRTCRCAAVGLPRTAFRCRSTPIFGCRLVWWIGRIITFSSPSRDAAKTCPAILSSATNRLPDGRRLSRRFDDTRRLSRYSRERRLRDIRPVHRPAVSGRSLACYAEGRHRLVKFAVRSPDPVARRWCDLLVMEALALDMVSSRGIPGSPHPDCGDTFALVPRKRTIRSGRGSRTYRCSELGRRSRRSGAFLGPGGGRAGKRAVACLMRTCVAFDGLMLSVRLLGIPIDTRSTSCCSLPVHVSDSRRRSIRSRCCTRRRRMAKCQPGRFRCRRRVPTRSMSGTTLARRHESSGSAQVMTPACQTTFAASARLTLTCFAPARVHEREERSLRTPFHPGRSRGPRHAGGSLAGHRHRAGHFVLVRADGVRGARREARRGEVELRSGHGVTLRRDGLGSAAEVGDPVRWLGSRLAAHRERVER